MTRQIINVDNPDTWPEQIRRFISNYVKARSWRDGWDADSESHLDSLFEGEQVLAYHHTRLLETERRDIRQNGMPKTDDEPVRHKLELAVEIGAITEEHARALNEAAVHRQPRFGRRDNQVCPSLDPPMGWVR